MASVATNVPLGYNHSSEVLAAAKTLTATDSGTTFFLTLAGGFTVTLPAPKDGLSYRFIVAVAPTTAYIIASASAANVINGQICTAADGTAVTTAAASDVINFVASQAILGDYVEMISDGTSWLINGMCAVAAGMTTVQTA
jgi:hypothetical protein